MNKRKRQTSKNNNRNSRSRRPKEVEVNIPRDDLNDADLRGDKRKYGRKTREDNDISWYSKDPSLIRSAAELTYLQIAGQKLPWNVDANIIHSMNSIPGILALEIELLPGTSPNENTPLNVASKNIYSFVRHANSGHSNYESSDLMLYLLAMDQLYSYHAFCTRIYGLTMAYSSNNRYIPKAVLQAMGVNVDDVQTNAAQLLTLLNRMKNEINSLAVPSTMSLFLRHNWMFSNLFIDEDIANGQYYLFKPSFFWKYSPKTSETGGQLLPSTIPYGGVDWTVKNLELYYNDLINQILPDEDMNIMSGDIMKAYGDNLFKLGEVPYGYMVTPVYSPEVLTQIQNATIIPKNLLLPTSGSAGTNTQSISQVNNMIYTALWQTEAPTSTTLAASFWQSWYWLAAQKKFNCPIMNPTPEFNMIASRFTVIAPKYGDNQSVPFTLNRTVTGSDIVVGMQITRFRYNGDGTVSIVNQSFTPTIAKSNLSNFVPEITMISQFAFHPTLDFITPTANTTGKDTVITIDGYLFNVQNMTVLDRQTVENMHQIALLSEFNVPQ